MVGIAVTDAALHEKTADFDFFDYEADETEARRLIPPGRPPRSFNDPDPAVIRFRAAAWPLAGAYNEPRNVANDARFLGPLGRMGFAMGCDGRKRKVGQPRT